MPRLPVVVLALLAAAPAAAQSAGLPPGARPLPPDMTGTWALVELEEGPGVVVEVLDMRLEVEGNRVTQRDSLRLPTGDVEARAFTMDCVLYDLDRSERRPGLEPAVLRDMTACTLVEAEAGLAKDGGYGQVAVEGDVLAMGAPEIGYRAVFRRVAE